MVQGSYQMKLYKCLSQTKEKNTSELGMNFKVCQIGYLELNQNNFHYSHRQS